LSVRHRKADRDAARAPARARALARDARRLDVWARSHLPEAVPSRDQEHSKTLEVRARHALLPYTPPGRTTLGPAARPPFCFVHARRPRRRRTAVRIPLRHVNNLQNRLRILVRAPTAAAASLCSSVVAMATTAGHLPVPSSAVNRPHGRPF
jgi:hypothetical protein